MRILYLVHDFFPHFHGGTERYVLNIARQMQRMGHSVSVLTYGLKEPPESFTSLSEGVFVKAYSYEGIPVICIRHQKMPENIGLLIEDHEMEKAIEAIVREKKFNIVHIAHPLRMGSCYKVAKKLGIPVVLTLTDFWLLCPWGRFYKPDYSLCNSPDDGKKCRRECGLGESILNRYNEAKRLFETVDALISPSRFLMEIFRANGWKRQIYHVRHGVDYKYVETYDRGKKHPGVVIFGYAGLVSRFKGVDLLVKSFSEVKSPHILLKLYGNLIEWEINFCSELNLLLAKDERVRLMGKYSHEELSSIMRDIDILVVPSTTLESYGLVVVEALAYNVPVIASDIVGSAYEFIQHGKNGMIFSVQNPSELAEIIRQIADNPSLVDTLRSNISHPPRLEEEAFMVEKIYKSVLH